MRSVRSRGPVPRAKGQWRLREEWTSVVAMDLGGTERGLARRISDSTGLSHEAAKTVASHHTPRLHSIQLLSKHKHTHTRARWHQGPISKLHSECAAQGVGGWGAGIALLSFETSPQSVKTWVQDFPGAQLEKQSIPAREGSPSREAAQVASTPGGKGKRRPGALGGWLISKP